MTKLWLALPVLDFLALSIVTGSLVFVAVAVAYLLLLGEV